MLIIDKLLPQGRGLSAALRARAPTVTLDWDQRRRSRLDATDSAGRALALFLPRGAVLRGGDVGVAEDGSLVVVQAAPQPLLRVTPHPERGTPFDLLRAAYHLGNRHVELELRRDHLQFEPDPVLAEMLRGLGLVVAEVHEAFEPEGGAYGGGQGGGHGHGHGPAAGHGAAHAHPAGHDHDHDLPHAH